MLRASSIVLALLAAASQTTAPPAARPGLDISLERKTAAGKIEPMAPDHVFEPGDVIRFRVKSDFDGYLYVMDQGSSGSFSTVFPSQQAGADNSIHKGQSYLLPATDESWFEIGGPSGFDVFYFLLSPSPITPPSAASFASPAPASSMRPRCNDAIFKARGECTDISAGPAPVPRNAPLPAPIAPIAGAASRDITVVKKKDGVTVGAGGDRTAPVIYTFRLAHH
jgi:hypothetical protein